MCIVAPARIIELDAGIAVVDVAGRRRRASVLLAPDLEVGDWVLVAAGNVVRRIDADAAAGLTAELEAAVAATEGSARSFQQPTPQTTRQGGTR
jgi:hydrogenase expression/formation protein HypC